MAIFIFDKIGKVFSRRLLDGKMSISHDFNRDLQAIVEPICRGRGKWDKTHSNWVIDTQHISFVVAALYRRNHFAINKPTSTSKWRRAYVA